MTKPIYYYIDELFARSVKRRKACTLTNYSAIIEPNEGQNVYSVRSLKKLKTKTIPRTI